MATTCKNVFDRSEITGLFPIELMEKTLGIFIHSPCFLYILYIWPNGIIFHQPRFSWNKGSHFPSKKLPFGWPRLWFRSRANLIRIHNCFAFCIKKLNRNTELVGGFKPFETYSSSQNGNLPQVGVKITNIWNHHLARHFLTHQQLNILGREGFSKIASHPKLAKGWIRTESRDILM